MTLHVLFVCTGNICRSPMAERLFRARAGAHYGEAVSASSVGTRAVAGYGMDAPSALVLRDLGGDPDGHVARQISIDAVRSAGLVLTATGEHRSAVVRAEPQAMRRTFTMREFVRLGGGLTMSASADLDARIAEVAAQRGVLDPGEPGGDEIADPFGAALEEARECGRAVSAAVDGILAILGLVPGTRAGD